VSSVWDVPFSWTVFIYLENHKYKMVFNKKYFLRIDKIFIFLLIFKMFIWDMARLTPIISR
jgi:hypothetical protein